MAVAYNTSIQYYIPLYVSSITYAHPQEVFNCIGAGSGIVVSVCGHPVHMLRERERPL